MNNPFEYYYYGTPASAFGNYEPARTEPQDDYWGAEPASAERPTSLSVSVSVTKENAENEAVFGVAA